LWPQRWRVPLQAPMLCTCRTSAVSGIWRFSAQRLRMCCAYPMPLHPQLSLTCTGTSSTSRSRSQWCWCRCCAACSVVWQASGMLSAPGGGRAAPAALPLAVEAAWRLRSWPLLSDLLAQCDAEVGLKLNHTMHAAWRIFGTVRGSHYALLVMVLHGGISHGCMQGVANARAASRRRTAQNATRMARHQPQRKALDVCPIVDGGTSFACCFSNCSTTSHCVSAVTALAVFERRRLP
jgi:hypothetical protein